MSIITLLFGTYWPQVTLILLGIGYFIKRLFDQKAKQKEIKYELFQQNKLQAIHSFLDGYTEIGKMWLLLNPHDIVNEKIAPKELDNIIYPKIENLKRCNNQLILYLDPQFQAVFEKVLTDQIEINKALLAVNVAYMMGDSDVTKKIIQFDTIKRSRLQSAGELIRSVSDNIREGYLK